jgi:hypothetical protein
MINFYLNSVISRHILLRMQLDAFAVYFAYISFLVGDTHNAHVTTDVLRKRLSFLLHSSYVLCA